MIPQSDTEMIDRARGGDPGALADLVRLWDPRVRRFASRLCPATEVLDVAQESLLILISKIRSLRSAEALVSWSFQIVRRQCIRAFSRIVRETALVRDLGWLEGAGAPARPDRTALVEELGKSLLALAPADREILVLKDIEDLSLQETGARLGVSLAAVKSRLHRARLNLRAKMLASPLARTHSGW